VLLQQLLLAMAVLLVALLAIWRTQLRREARRHALTKERFESLFVNNTDAVVSVGSAGAVDNVNPTFTRLTGWTGQETQGTAFVGYVTSEDRPRVLETVKTAVSGKPSTIDTALQHRDGSVVEVELTTIPILVDEEVVGTYHIARDIGQRKETERKLETQALHDYLTGLPNRSLFEDRLEHAIERGRRGGTRIALAYLDLDGFKAVNDTAGHAAGDQLLQEVGSRLSRFLRGGDTVARLGGDEFAVLLEDVGDADGALRAAKRIADLFVEPITVEGSDVKAGASIGLAISSVDMETSEELVRQADVAMYAAKRLGGYRYELYTAELEAANEEAGEPAMLEEDLRGAIERGELTVHYQPIVDLAGTRIVGVEALVRWPHPELGMLSPASFIPVAEESGIIVDVDHLVLRQACREIHGLIEKGVTTTSSFFLSVNFSRRHFDMEDPAGAVRDIVSLQGLEFEQLQLEISESIVGIEREKIRALKALGLMLAVDDFGMGSSSLNYLKDLDADVLKLDRSFVQAIGASRSSLAAVRTILTLAGMLDVEVIMEGIEEPAQLRRLQDLGARLVQGFYFGGPMELEALESLLREGLPPDWALRRAAASRQDKQRARV
jgi:diguanylate cyclase (GGDEF)-like protein/PAS domain S-box-containing protein